MTGKPEQRSLDEVKRLLRSLEETSADDKADRSLAALTPKPMPVATPSEPAMAAPVVTPLKAEAPAKMADRPAPVPPVAMLKAEPAAERTHVARVIAGHLAPPQLQRPSTSLVVAGVAAAAGFVGIAGAALWVVSGTESPSQPTAAAAKSIATVTRVEPARPSQPEPKVGTQTADVNRPAAPVVTAVGSAKNAAPAEKAEQRPVQASSGTAAPRSAVAQAPASSATTSAPADLRPRPAAPQSGAPRIAQAQTSTAAPAPPGDVPEPAKPAAPQPPVEAARPTAPTAAPAPVPAPRPVTQAPVAASPAAPIVSPAQTAPQSAAPTMSDHVRPSDAEIAKLVADGKTQLASGQVATARLLFQRAAEAGNGEAARLLGDTYDPAKLFALGVRGTSGDMEKAIHWYERADELGDPQAKARLAPLGTR